jgi:hypothetical protein
MDESEDGRPAEKIKVKKEPQDKKEDTMDIDEEDGVKIKQEDDINEDDEEDSDQEDSSFLNDEPLASGGVAAALELAKRRGMHRVLKEEQLGRETDKTFEMGKDDPAPNIKLEYRDKQGRPLKPKEAFRMMSHVFHGRGPGTTKAEKKLKRLKESEKKRKAVQQDADGSDTLKKLKAKQKQTGQAYVVLDKKASSGETRLALPDREVAARPKATKKAGTVKPTKIEKEAVKQEPGVVTLPESDFSSTSQPADSDMANAANRQKVQFGIKRKRE